jgi:sugar lactone lactonase YvrE
VLHRIALPIGLLFLANPSLPALQVHDQLPPTLPTVEDSRLIDVASSTRVINGVTTTPDGRMFVSHPQVEGPGAQVSEYRNGTFVPYPTPDYNLWKPDGDRTKSLMKVNSVRVGLEGDLWVVDAGATRVGGKAVPGAAKIVRIDVKTNTIKRTYSPPRAVMREYSYFNDIRFNGAFGYISDSAGLDPAIVVLNTATGEFRRVLENHPLMIARFRMYSEGRQLVLAEPIPAWWGGTTTDKMVNVDQIEVSPDGAWLYFQPIGGPLARVRTSLIESPTVSKDALYNSVEKLNDTWTAAGTAIDAAGTIYMSQVNTRSVMTIAPDGQVATLISDPRLRWVDAMWIDKDGFLFMPAAQLDKTSANLAGAPAQIEYPVHVWKMQIGRKPAPNDHR